MNHQIQTLSMVGEYKMLSSVTLKEVGQKTPHARNYEVQSRCLRNLKAFGSFSLFSIHRELQLSSGESIAVPCQCHNNVLGRPTRRIFVQKAFNGRPGGTECPAPWHTLSLTRRLSNLRVQVISARESTHQVLI